MGRSLLLACWNSTRADESCLTSFQNAKLLGKEESCLSAKICVPQLPTYMRFTPLPISNFWNSSSRDGRSTS